VTTTRAEPGLRERLDGAIRHLAAIDRSSASPGERAAAAWVADALRAEGAAARVEEERAHGTYWWPLGLPSALAAAAGLAGRRRPALLTGAFAAAAIADDVTGGRQWFRRVALPRRRTANVVGELGDPSAPRTVVLVAHHDAAHTGLVFTPRFGEVMGRRFPRLLARTDTTPPIMWPVVAGPALVAVGAALGSRRLRRTGAWMALAATGVFAEIGTRPTVPGANDNLSGVAVLLGLARRLREQPAAGVRVLLVSTGAEESFMEGMQAFVRRHRAALRDASARVICVDTVGSPQLVLLEGEGMLRMREYPAAFKDLVATCAERAGVPLRRGLRFRNATDGLIALRAGLATAMLGSVNRFKLPDNYHWPSDVPDNVALDTVLDAVTVCEAVVQALAEGG
jgi:hypothetical protein